MTLIQISALLAFCLLLILLTVRARGFLRSQSRGFASRDSRLGDADIADMVRNGELLAAMRAYRELHGVTLKEAKGKVEAMAESIAASKFGSARQ